MPAQLCLWGAAQVTELLVPTLQALGVPSGPSPPQARQRGKVTCHSPSLPSGKSVHSMVAHLDAVTCLAVDPNGVFLMSGSKSGPSQASKEQGCVGAEEEETWALVTRESSRAP